MLVLQVPESNDISQSTPATPTSVPPSCTPPLLLLQSSPPETENVNIAPQPPSNPHPPNTQSTTQTTENVINPFQPSLTSNITQDLQPSLPPQPTLASLATLATPPAHPAHPAHQPIIPSLAQQQQIQPPPAHAQPPPAHAHLTAARPASAPGGMGGSHVGDSVAILRAGGLDNISITDTDYL